MKTFQMANVNALNFSFYFFRNAVSIKFLSCGNVVAANQKMRILKMIQRPKSNPQN